ncbi:MAG: Arc family DNA-binding protein [Lachnospiraceae bacterium]|nr:Arc family DNA-binding protein [Lachnospiraceae bacterium]
MEKDVREKEKQLKEKEKAKKQVLLRLSPSLWQELASWADEDFRSINSQIEFLLSECVRKRKKN